MRKLRYHLTQQESCMWIALIYVAPSVFIAIIKCTPVRLSEVMKTSLIKHSTGVVMTNWIYLRNVFYGESCLEGKVRFFC